ncbi:hypothetical protein EV663_101148 [Rhodovulum bhavnagarense]|uniref:Uncharacterized protein n=1 Tax=Rhodovulum bhavnagarense TaxID=992286 RepID=A0A4R2RJG5_9RHOB|nr:hypothetical protein [Rhodovulum bhavnagarense]TCP62888.1 hypothetical protein EV663_101148 [Rhodovulum bhavnagarense]
MFTKSALLAAALAVVAGSASAWTDMAQPHDPNSTGPRSVAGPNYCRDGLQPVEWNGVVSCGGTYRPAYIRLNSLDEVPPGYVGRVYHLRYGNPGTQPLQ